MKRAVLLLASAALVASLAAAEGARCPKTLETCLTERRAMLQKRGVLGLLFSQAAVDEPVPPGAQYVVRSVPLGYPAWDAGLREHDVLLAINGKDLAGMALPQVLADVQRVSIGDRVSLRVWREGRTLTLTLRAAKPTAESIEAWLGQHVKDEHPKSDFSEYLRRSRKAPR